MTEAFPLCKLFRSKEFNWYFENVKKLTENFKFSFQFCGNSWAASKSLTGHGKLLKINENLENWEKWNSTENDFQDVLKAIFEEQSFTRLETLNESVHHLQVF